MKIKNLKTGILTAVLLFLLTSCSKDFLELEPNGNIPESNYYKTEAEAYAGLVSVYDVLNKQSGGFENMICMMNAGSDDHFAGGGSPTDGIGIHSFSNYTLSASTLPNSFWNNFYQGVYRANLLISKLPAVPMDASRKARFEAEAKMLRAYYYFELVRLFKNVPLIVAPILPEQINTVTQASPAAVYAQIEQDLISARNVLPTVLPDPANDNGRMTKGAAQALLGKVYLYQGKNGLAAAEFAVVNGTPGGTSIYGYKLLTNFASLWSAFNKFNTEGIIEISHSNLSNANYGTWGSGAAEGNLVNQMVGPRGYVRLNSSATDYTGGWSFNPITQSLYNALNGDPRFNATIADLKAQKLAGLINYLPGDQDTGYFLKKFMPTTANISSGGGEQALNYRQNTYAIRLADTYLMEAEALGGIGARAQALLDAVRARVGLAAVPVTQLSIFNERRLELAGEGHRWFDLVRTNRAAAALANRGFVAGKNEIFPVPQNELLNTLIVQNPNY